MSFSIAACTGSETAKIPEVFSLDDYAPAMAVAETYDSIDRDSFDAMIEQLKTLDTQCQDMGLDCPYETARIRVLEQFRYSADMDQIKYVTESLTELYNDTLERYWSYLSGNAVPQQVPDYACTTVVYKDGGLYALDKDGDSVVVSLVGFGHWTSALDSYLYSFDDYGFHSVQVEIDPDAIIKQRGNGSHEGLNDDDEFDYNLDALASIEEFIQHCEESNVSVCLLLSPHYFPSFLYDIYPDLKLTDESRFIKYCIEHPVAKRVVEAFLDAFIPIMDKYDNVSNFCLSNEPDYKTEYSQYDSGSWTAYLEKEFGTVDVFNSKLNTSYASLEDIPKSDIKKSGIYYNYIIGKYNETVLADWHEWMYNIVKSMTDKNVDVKVMSWRNDYEQYDFMDDAGCDTFAYLNDEDNTLYDKMRWYDYSNSVIGACVVNTEDHITRDYTSYDEDTRIALSDHVYTDLFEGALHGRSFNAIWTWNTSNGSDSDVKGHISARPLCLVKASDAAHDLLRLNNEVNAFATVSPDIYIYYSTTTKYWFSGYDDSAIAPLYEVAVNAGYNVGFVTDTTIGQLPSDACVLATMDYYIPDDSFAVLSDFVRNGGTLFIDAVNSRRTKPFKYDPYKISRDDAVLNELYNSSVVIESGGDYTELINLFQQETGIVPEVVLKVNGETATGIAYSSVEYGDSILVNVCNMTYGTDSVNIEVYYNGEKVEAFTDLISGTSYDGTVTVEALHPLMLSFSK